MAISSAPVAGILLILSLLIPHTVSQSADSILSELSNLQFDSPTGVIHLTDSLLRRILSIPTPRPFHFIVFFDAKQLHSKPKLSLPQLKAEFSFVSSSYLTNNPNQQSLASRIFFFDIEFKESQSSFDEFGINALPHIRLVPLTTVDLKTDSIPLDGASFSGLAESLAAFIESRAKISIGPITRPPSISKSQIILIVAVVLISIPYFVKKLISGNAILHEKNIWMAGAIFVYFFSVSGAMFNIIRKMPFFMLDREDPSKLIFFYRGAGMQFGAEGFTIGTLYTIVGLLLAFMTHVLVRVKSRNMQRLLLVVVLFVSFLAVEKVVSLNMWKTGYRLRIYLPSSWL